MSLNHEFDVLIVGGGPAGIAAATCAAKSGLRVGMVDDNPSAGGQIWRGEQSRPGSRIAAQWLHQLEGSSVDWIGGAKVTHQPAKGVLNAETFDELHILAYDKLILANGARERFLPFPGWTLPNVMGAGGLQALVKSGMPIRGKQVVVAGSGPLLLAVAAYLRMKGAVIRLMAEQADWMGLFGFGVSLWKYPGKLIGAVALKRDLSGVPYLTGCWPLAAKGREKLESVTLQHGKKVIVESCDYLACGFNIVPNLELALLLGCRIEENSVWVNEWQESSVEGIFCAGETTGVGGLELSLIEGQIAGYAAVGRHQEAGCLFRKRQRFRTFSTLLRESFHLRDELKWLSAPETIVCRCEDVTFDSLRRFGSWRDAKLQTRCGMGSCQGRICGTATQFLFGWGMESVRPPIFPARLSSFVEMPEVSDSR